MDGKHTKTYDEFHGGVTFSPDSSRVAYGVKHNGLCFVVADNSEGPVFDSLLHPGPIFSPDSKHLAFSAKYKGKYRLVVDGIPCGEPYDGTLKGINPTFDSPTILHAVVIRGTTFYRLQVTLTQ